MADPLSISGGVVGVISLGITVLNGVIGYYEAYRDEREDIRRTTKSLTDLRDLLRSLESQYKKRAHWMSNDEVTEGVLAFVANCSELIDELKEELDKFQRTPVQGTKAIFTTVGKRLAYPFRQSTLKKLDENIGDIVKNLTLRMHLFSQKDVCNMRDDIVDAHTLLEMIKSEQESMYRGLENTQKCTIDTKELLETLRARQLSYEIKAWLRAPDVSVNFNAALEKTCEGTGAWFLDSELFGDWLLQENTFLWLVGFAGCGKSVLCSNIIHRALAHLHGDTEAALAFFFFTFSDQAKQDASAMLRAILVQLCGQVRDGDRRLAQFYKDNGHNTPLVPDLLNCLLDISRASRKVYVVLDALDEVPKGDSRSQVLQVIRMLRQDLPNVRVIVSSRDEIDIRSELGVSSEETITLKNKWIERDIISFIDYQLENCKDLRDLVEFHGIIRERLAAQANGVFRWVQCHLEGLKDCPRCEDLLEKYLANLPPTLPETYHRMLSNIPKHSRQYAQRILTIICCAKRPLGVEELAEAVAVELEGEPTYNTKRELGGYSDFQKICPGFLELNMGTNRQVSTVRLAHSSIQEYLTSDDINEDKRDSRFTIDMKLGHTKLASICLTILLQQSSSLKLARYAALNWPSHLDSGHEDPTIQRQINQLFCMDEWTFRSWLFNRMEEYGLAPMASLDLGVKSRTYLPLCFAAALGLNSVIPGLMKADKIARMPSLRTNDCNTFWKWKSPLAIAAAGSHETTLLLLSTGATVEDLNEALLAATFGGSSNNINCLLDLGADLRYTSIPLLEAAVQAGAKGAICTILKRGASLSWNNKQRDLFGSALHEACLSDHEDLVYLLLDGGVDIHGRDDDFGTALHAASAKGSEQLVRTLLHRGADIESQSRIYGTPLQAASAEVRLGVVSLLIDAGANMEASGGEHGAPLPVAIDWGHLSLMQLLVEKGAKVHPYRQHRPYDWEFWVDDARLLFHFFIDNANDIRSRGSSSIETARSLGLDRVAFLLASSWLDTADYSSLPITD